ncbi:hypothetical protein AALO_G00162070 [Alosa alosa]|uniref:Uncharacterized protein n=1 Tax=Alosa alosa TaxID=278164 RepID=A0AAV6GAG4_9TELE|nr:hypothetical protein AALO_G00162070 [Alosa alosa]
MCKTKQNADGRKEKSPEKTAEPRPSYPTAHQVIRSPGPLILQPIRSSGPQALLSYSPSGYQVPSPLILQPIRLSALLSYSPSGYQVPSPLILQPIRLSALLSYSPSGYQVPRPSYPTAHQVIRSPGPLILQPIRLSGPQALLSYSPSGYQVPSHPAATDRIEGGGAGADRVLTQKTHCCICELKRMCDNSCNSTVSNYAPMCFQCFSDRANGQMHPSL